ncbi:UNKNOWN [Stylonychia lemnae]|uniref:Uncharacterized protein n=1 Tax=Stylonychia lemnae TaxID=5949 RepID=A0A078B7X4_STYLE|nr:UNKNOWN [Stylonychia lemnae]|eukprot:CDW90321.1 UNKNOWN [Stylonychia lemnae]
MQKLLFSASILLGYCGAIQISHALEKQRSQLGWRQEATNKFSWNETQKLEWTVVNAFVDVQTSPDGDVYAIQKIGSEPQETKYLVYLFDVASNLWSITNRTFQAKAVRFDRLGTMYYLSPDNCVLNSEKVPLVCGLSDFEVTVNKQIIGLNDNSGKLAADQLVGAYHTVNNHAQYSYKALSGYKGITLIKDIPILIADDGSVDANYGGEKLVSISAGIDGSLWALKYEENVADYKLLKWQTIAQKWYLVPGANGTSLSAYNEISVALVDHRGLLSLSSQAGNQNEAIYTTQINQQPAPPVPTLPPVLAYGSSFASSSDFQWIIDQTQAPIKGFAQLFKSTASEGKTFQEAFDALKVRENVTCLFKNKAGIVSGFYSEGQFPADHEVPEGGEAAVYEGLFIIFSLTSRKPYKNAYYAAQLRFSSDSFRIQVTNEHAGMIVAPECRVYSEQDKLQGLEDQIFEIDEGAWVPSVILNGEQQLETHCDQIEFYTTTY